VIYCQELDFLGYISLPECVRASSTTFTQWAPKATEFGKIAQTTRLEVIQGHQFWYQLKAHMQLPISD